MKTIFFIHGDKGGVGKTEAAKRVAAVMLQAGKPLTLIDGDNKNPGLHLAFKNSGMDVQCLNVMKSSGLETLFEAITNSPGDVLVDLPARGSDVTEKLSRDGASEDGFSLELVLEEIAAEIVVIFVIDQTRPPLIALRDEMTAMPASTKWVIVKNRKEEREFDLFDGSSLKSNLEARNVAILDMTRLDPRVNDIMENNGLNLITVQESDKLSMLQKIRAKAALRLWSEEMKTAGLIT